MKYTVIEKDSDIVATGNNKAKMIKVCREYNKRATVVNEKFDIIYENAIQRAINKGYVQE